MNIKNTLTLSRISLFSIIFCVISSMAYADKGGNGNGNNGNGGGNASVSSPEPSAILTFFVLAGVVLVAKRKWNCPLAQS